MTGLKQTRVIGCQGSIQLITATNVAHNYPLDYQNNYLNYLIVYELFAPNGQHEDFFQFIKSLAESGPVKYEKIIYIDPIRLQQLIGLADTKGLDEASFQLQQLTGLKGVDELYLCSNWQPGNSFLLNCLPSDKKISYGDSIGLYIPENYFSDKTGLTSILNLKNVKSVRQWYKAIRLTIENFKRKPFFKILNRIPFDKGYYLTTNLAKEKPLWSNSKVSKAMLFEIFLGFSKNLKFALLTNHIFENEKLVFMLTTNFSEAGKMSLENEIQAYKDYLKKNIDVGDLLIIKPHPRDSRSKIDLLKSVLSLTYKVKVLDDTYDFYIPFELLLIQLRNAYPQIMERDKIKFLTFSTACLSIQTLFDQVPLVGFGPKLVNRFFVSSHKTSRLKHESDLVRLMMP